jgi:hypothetical protein
MKLDYIECRPDWVATFRCPRTDKFVCLMRTPRGHWYWRYPEYEGLFPWGATGPRDLNFFAGRAQQTGADTGGLQARKSRSIARRRCR